MKCLRYTFFLILLFPLTVGAAAWLQSKGDSLIIGNAQIYNSCQYWNNQGQLKKGPCFNQFAIAPYYEYGFMKKLTLILNPTFNSFSQSSQSVPFNFENVFIGARYELWQKDWDTLSIQFVENIPIRRGQFGNPATPTAVYAIINRLSYLDARVLYGTGGTFDKDNYNTWYADAELAYQPNFSGGAGETRINFMLGWKTQNSRLVFELQELNAITSHNPSRSNLPSYNLCTAMADIIYWYKPNVAAFQLGLQQDFYGTNIGMGTAPFLSLWWKFN